MVLSNGTKIGDYEIEAPMPGTDAGEAYKASDTAHGRSVTLRLLQANAPGDADQTARIEGDAQALAALAHEGIAAVYDVVTHENSLYRVSEYLEGETLARRLERGPFGLADALRIGIALADAVDYAHRHGIVHRALSPSAVVLTNEGVKVVDFGIDPVAADGSEVPATSMASTRTIVPSAMAAATGVMPYQAPEQLDGGEIDARSDVFALGTLLYEMLTGKPAFAGKTQALLIAAITTVDPDPVSESQPLAPPALDFLIRRCLAKDPKKRLQTARDLASQLRWIAGEGGALGGLAASLEAQRKRARQVRIGLAAAVLLVLGLAPLAYWSLSDAPAPQEARFIVNDMGFAIGTATSAPQLSPDGRWLISSRGLTDGLDALALDSVTKQILLYGHAVFLQFWNPANGEEVAFWEDDLLKKALVAGGEPTNIVEVPRPYGGGTWSPDGIIVYSSQGVLYRVLDTGGEAVQISSLDDTEQETEHLWPTFLPDGRHFIYLALSSSSGKSAIYVGSLDSEERTRLIEAESRPWYAEPGYILFNRADVVFAQAFDPEALAVSGEPHRIVDGLAMGAASLNGEISGSQALNASFSVSNTGLLAYRMGAGVADGAPNAAGAGQPRSLVWFTPTGPQAVQGVEGTFAGLDLAPDDRRFAIHRHEPGGGDIWLYDPDQGGMRRWTFDTTQENSSPVWSPEGDRIAFASRRGGRWGIWVKNVDGTGDETMLVEGDVPIGPMSWAPNGEIVYWVRNAATGDDIWAVPSTGDGEARSVIATAATERYPQVSPDGNWIAYEKPDDGGVEQIWVNSFPEPRGSGWQITNDQSGMPRWRTQGEGLELFFWGSSGFAVYSVDLRVAGAAIQPTGMPELVFSAANWNLPTSDHYAAAASYYRFAVSGDGQRFLAPQPLAAGGAGDGAAPLADTIRNTADAGGAGTANEIPVILDWTRLIPE